MNSLKEEDVLLQIRDKLQKDGIKLWLVPYFEESKGPSLEHLQLLARQYSEGLQLRYEACYEALTELQTNALEKLKQRDRFKESGLATIKIKVMNKGAPRILNQELLLASTNGSELKTLIANEIHVPIERIKLISNGSIIKDDLKLSQQAVKNSTQVLAIILSESATNLKEDESRYKDLEETKADTTLLATDTSYMQLEDQHGNTIHIPSKEKKALLLAMALHEKGRTALKRDDYARALVFFLDADKEFSQCNSQLLNHVDNYALLDLDIAWCYLCLQSLVHLPEAFTRLKRCEEMFKRSYGANLERLIALKGSSGNEASLFMRLHLLQAIVLYHQNKRVEALNMLQTSQAELQTLKVDENKLLALVELGYSTAEARIGLRATQGDVNSAANYINEIRSKREESRRKAVAEKILQSEREKLGLCKDGSQYVEPSYVNMLVNMGYNKHAAKVALQQTNNVISDSIQYIQEHPQAGPSNTKSQEFLSLLEDLIPELTSAGFDYNMAKRALQKHAGDILKATEDLLDNNGVIEEIPEEMDDENKNVNSKEEKKKKKEALQRLAQDISTVDDDHLDLSLEKEEEFLNLYLSLLS